MNELQLWQITGAWIVFISVYFVLALGYLPFFKLDRTGTTFVGAVSIVFLGILTDQQAFMSQDYETLILLFSMMIIASFLINSGILGHFEHKLLSKIKTPRSFLWIVIITVGFSSALFINDVICLVFTPIVILLAKRLSLNAEPYILATAMSSNIGSVMTPVGNPQNIFIASNSGISYAKFVLTLMPVSIAGLIILGICLELFYRNKWILKSDGNPEINSKDFLDHPIKLYVIVRTTIVLLAVLVCFWTGFQMGKIAAMGAAFLLFTRRVPRKKIFDLIDWNLLILFISLFIITAGARKAGIIQYLYGQMSIINPENTISLSVITLFLSNIVSNVPAVFFLGQVIPNFANPESSWLLVAMISTLAGNLTIIGSIANIIVLEKAGGAVSISFWKYAKVGIPVTLLTVVISLLYWLVIF